MNVLGANISVGVVDYLNNNLKNIVSFEIANQKIYDDFHLIDFFNNEEDFKTLRKNILDLETTHLVEERADYGDFQTNLVLATKIVTYLKSKNTVPEIIIEPTCGKGNFIIASLLHFDNIEKIIGVEIYKPYVWETKFNIIDFYLCNSKENKPKILINHCNVFDFNFHTIAKDNCNKEILVIGNPPWVTNAKLGKLNSSNIPKKNNYKNFNGLDAVTGKGNFDIAEYITMMMIETFKNQKGNIALLLKNTVIKNIMFEQFTECYQISNIEQHRINSKKEFNVSVKASLFYCELNSLPTFECLEYDFYSNSRVIRKYGWLSDKFVSNLDKYINFEHIDGKCPFEWRQGLKHDCSAIMELEKVNGYYENGLNEKIIIENDLIYGILKSSDLKNSVIKEARKYTIVTQKNIGQDTNYIKYNYPKTYKYLIDHQDIFNSRKSGIYNNKPPFSIFGVGDYTFKPYKVAISGLYKTFHFSLVLPENDRPILLDDTCYMLSFDKTEYAVYALLLLNCEITAKFLQSITFNDAKRIFTKDILMRIDLLELAKTIDQYKLQQELNYINEKYNLKITLEFWFNFIEEMMSGYSNQLLLFA